MTLKKRNLLGSINRFRLMLTLALAVLLPAAALIYVNFSQLRSFDRDKFLQAAIHRDFHRRQKRLLHQRRKIRSRRHSNGARKNWLVPALENC